MNPITLDGGAILHVPPDDEDLPVLPSAAHTLHPPSGSPDSAPDSGGNPPRIQSYGSVRFGKWAQNGSPLMGSPGPAKLGRPSEHAPSLRRAGDDLRDDAPPLQRPRTDSQRAREEADDEFRERHKLP